MKKIFETERRKYNVTFKMKNILTNNIKFYIMSTEHRKIKIWAPYFKKRKEEKTDWIKTERAKEIL